MANSIEFAKNYTGTLDEVYQGAAVSRCLNSGGRMVRAGRNAKEILIPKISVTGLGDYTRNVGYKTGSITYECETHSFGYDRAIRLFADVTDVEESGVLDCFVEAGAELQRTQVTPEGDANTFSQIASTDGVTVKGEDLSEASAVDVLDALRTVTNDMDERRVSTGSRYLFITPTLRGVLDDFSLANPTRSNRVLERFSRIVEVPQVRFYTAIACSPATTTSSATREGRRFLCRHHGHRGGQLEDLLHQERRRVHGRGVANQERARELLALGLAHVQQLQPPGGRDGRLRALYDERSERVQAGRGRRADRLQRRPAHVVLGVLLRRRRGRAHGELNAGLDARACDIEQDSCAIGKYVGLGFTPWDGVTGPTHRQHLTSATFAADMVTYSYLNLNYLFYSCTNLASVSGLGSLSGVRSMRYTFSSCAFTTIDFRGFDPSTFMDLFYTFSGATSSPRSTRTRSGRFPRAASRARNASTRAPRRRWVATVPCGPATRRRTRISE